MLLIKTNRQPARVAKKEVNLLPELTVFFDEFKKLYETNPAYLLNMQSLLGGLK